MVSGGSSVLAASCHVASADRVEIRKFTLSSSLPSSLYPVAFTECINPGIRWRLFPFLGGPVLSPQAGSSGYRTRRPSLWNLGIRDSSSVAGRWVSIDARSCRWSQRRKCRCQRVGLKRISTKEVEAVMRAARRFYQRWGQRREVQKTSKSTPWKDLNSTQLISFWIEVENAEPPIRIVFSVFCIYCSKDKKGKYFPGGGFFAMKSNSTATLIE